MRLVENQIPAMLRCRRVEEVIEANFEDLRRRGVTGNMSAKIIVGDQRIQPFACFYVFLIALICGPLLRRLIQAFNHNQLLPPTT